MIDVPIDNLEACCAPGATFRDESIQLSPAVALRVVTFSPPAPSPYPPVVFVAGWISLVRGWQRVLREMTKDFRVHYVETREKLTSKIKGEQRFGVEEIGGEKVFT